MTTGSRYELEFSKKLQNLSNGGFTGSNKNNLTRDCDVELIAYCASQNCYHISLAALLVHVKEGFEDFQDTPSAFCGPLSSQYGPCSSSYGLSRSSYCP